MLSENALMKLRALRQHGIGKCDAKAAALVAKQICQAASLIREDGLALLFFSGGR